MQNVVALTTNHQQWTGGTFIFLVGAIAVIVLVSWVIPWKRILGKRR